ncbi:MAG: thiamine pyrophosphate-binding protein [Oscillospiraceae bacterium]
MTDDLNLTKGAGGMMTGAQAMVKCLENEGVKDVFGYPGAAICPFYDALADSGIRHILVRQEQNAGHAASGYARVSGRPAVCIATSGPGATNLITALATAYMDSIPVIAITGQVSSEQLGRDVFQEADITGAAEPFTKYSYIVKNAADIPRIFKEAFTIAGRGRPGPVLIDIPIDVQNKNWSFITPNRLPSEAISRRWRATSARSNGWQRRWRTVKNP